MKESSSGIEELSFDARISHDCRVGISTRVIGEYRWGNARGYTPCNLKSSGVDLGFIDTSLKTFLDQESQQIIFQSYEYSYVVKESNSEMRWWNGQNPRS